MGGGGWKGYMPFLGRGEGVGEGEGAGEGVGEETCRFKGKVPAISEKVQRELWAGVGGGVKLNHKR